MPIRFPYDRGKGLSVLLWFLHKHMGSIERMKLMKLVYFADRLHLSRHGRPIVGGTYYAMPFGHVCSELLSEVQRAADGADAPFAASDPKLIEDKGAPFDERTLSASDMAVLDEVEREYGRFSAKELSDISHKQLSYVKHDPSKAGGRRELIPYEDICAEAGVSDAMMEIIREDQEARELLS